MGRPPTRPDGPAFFLNRQPALELTEEKRRQHVAHHVTAAEVDPRVFVDLSTDEATAIGTLLSHDLRALEQFRGENS